LPKGTVLVKSVYDVMVNWDLGTLLGFTLAMLTALGILIIALVLCVNSSVTHPSTRNIVPTGPDPYVLPEAVLVVLFSSHVVVGRSWDTGRQLFGSCDRGTPQ
jgi:hypothetical protein